MSARLRLGTLELSHDERRVWKDEVAVPIGSRAFDVLSVLVEHRHEVVSKDRLLAHAWPSRIVEENNLTVQISALRRALGSELIATVPGRGYKLTADVVPIERAGMPHAPHPREAAHQAHDVVRGPAQGFIDVQDAGETHPTNSW